METPHRARKLRATLSWYLGKFQILTGIATLGAASVILTVSRNGRYGQNRKMPMQVFPVLFAAISFLLFTSRPKRRTTAD